MAAPPSPLRAGQERSAYEIAIRQTTEDPQPVGILYQPTVAHFGDSEHPLDHQEDLFDFRSDLRLGTVTSALGCTQRLMAVGFGLDVTRGMGSTLMEDVLLPTLGRIAPHPGFLPMKQGWQHLAGVHVRRRGHHGMDQRGPAWRKPPPTWSITSSRRSRCANGCCRCRFRCAFCSPPSRNCWRRYCR